MDVHMQGGSGTAIAPESDGRPEDVLNAELALGSLLFTSGAAGQRIRDSLLVLNEKLHGGRLHIFLGFEALILTLEGGAQRTVAMTGYPVPSGMNGQALAEVSTYLHALSDDADPLQVTRDLEALKARRTKKTAAVFAAVAIFAMIFGYFNNADALALLIIGIAAFIAGLFRELMVKEEHNYYLTVLATTLVATISAALLARVIPTGTPLVAIVIACIFLIPGFQLINGGWEIFRNHMHLGIPTIMVFVNVILIMGLGIIIVFLFNNPSAINGPGIMIPPGAEILIDTLLGAVATLCFCVLMNSPRQAYVVCLLCGAGGRLVRTLVVETGGNMTFGVFCGSLIIALMALVLCRDGTIPMLLPLVSAAVQFLPGYYFMLALQGMAQIINYGESIPYAVLSSTVESGLLALFISAAIVFGTLLPLLAFAKDRRYY